jgi:hypothetical protein
MSKKSCTDCNNLFAESTLKKYNGICGKCNTVRTTCKECKDTFTEKTLKKNNGICGRCANNSDSMSICSSTISSPKINCNICNKEFLQSTLNKYGGMCGKCANNVSQSVSQSVPQSPQTVINYQMYPQQPAYQQPIYQPPVYQQPVYQPVYQMPIQTQPIQPIQPIQSSTKNTKKVIPKNLRMKVWETRIGDKFWGNCFVCNMKLCCLDFACGHIQSENQGGQLILENMNVVCKSCNSKMGTENMLSFKERCYSSSIPIQLSLPLIQPSLPSII